MPFILQANLNQPTLFGFASHATVQDLGVDPAANGIELSVGASNQVDLLLWVRVTNRDAADAFLSFYPRPLSEVVAGVDRIEPAPSHIGPSLDGRVIPYDIRFTGGVLSMLASTNADGTGAPATGLRIDAAFENIT